MKRSVLLLFCLLAAAAASADAPDPRGRWVTASGNLEIEVAPCGQALCGTVVKVLANHSMSPGGGEMKAADARDPMGMKILRDFAPSEFADAGGAQLPTEWRGTIYNRENAKTYSCIMTVGPQGELLLRGYVGIPWIGSTQAWRRAGVSLGEAR